MDSNESEWKTKNPTLAMINYKAMSRDSHAMSRDRVRYRIIYKYIILREQASNYKTKLK